MESERGSRELVVYRCNICGVIFETKDKALRHKADKHGNGFQEFKIKNIRKPSTSTSDKETFLNLQLTTPDVVKSGVRNKGKNELRRCKFCQEIISSPYNSQIVIELVDQQEFLACLKCYGNLIKPSYPQNPDAFIKPRK